jgi:hypothetical protein
MIIRKPIQVSDRTHEIIRREAFSRSLESKLGTGDIYMHDVVAALAEEIQAKRKYSDLPDKAI